MCYFEHFFKDNTMKVNSLDENQFPVFGVTHLDDVLSCDVVGEIHQTIHCVGDGTSHHHQIES